jgi:ankyrin repeat protein
MLVFEIAFQCVLVCCQKQLSKNEEFNMHHQDRPLFFNDDMPLELQMEILSHLPYDSLVSSRRVNKIFDLLANEVLWKKQFEVHFPHHHVRKTNYATFRKIYEKEYANLSSEQRKLFSLVKQGKLTELKAILKLSDLDKVDKSDVSLLTWANRKGHQALLDYFYAMALKGYVNSHDILDTAKKDDRGRTILHWAIVCHQPVETIKLLLTQGCDPHAQAHMFQDALYLAARSGDSATLSLFLDKFHYDGMYQTLRAAVNEGHVDVFKLLLAAANKTESVDDYFMQMLLSEAACQGQTEMVSMLLASGMRFNINRDDMPHPLIGAARKGSAIMVNHLLDAGHDIETTTRTKYVGMTVLMVAARRGRTELVRLLLARGANIEAVDKNHYTSLMHAVRKGRVEVVKLLLANGADKELRNDNTIFLVTAASSGHADVVSALLSAGANIEATRTDLMYHRTALLVAAEKGHVDVVNILLAAGANKFATDSCGDTALALAKKNKHNEVMAALQNFHSFQSRLEKINDHGTIPHHLLCPLSKKIMNDPVTLSTGFTCDRQSLEAYISSQQDLKETTSPFTEKPIRLNALLAEIKSKQNAYRYDGYIKDCEYLLSRVKCPFSEREINVHQALSFETNRTMHELLEDFVKSKEEKANKNLAEKEKIRQQWPMYFNRAFSQQQQGNDLSMPNNEQPSSNNRNVS